jgi:hypothetical protein
MGVVLRFPVDFTRKIYVNLTKDMKNYGAYYRGWGLYRKVKDVMN